MTLPLSDSVETLSLILSDTRACARRLQVYCQTFGQAPDARVWPLPATLRWIGAPIMLGGWLVALGAALLAGGIIWAVPCSPWMIGNRSSGDCGGGSGSGGD